MCHEEIHRRSRADLADRDPVADRDCKCSPRIPVELLIRQQRLLTISRARERFCSWLKTWHFEIWDLQGGRLALASRPPSRCKINLADEHFCSLRYQLMDCINGAVGLYESTQERSKQSKADKNSLPGDDYMKDVEGGAR